jgi:hypothetical protein
MACPREIRERIRFIISGFADITILVFLRILKPFQINESVAPVAYSVWPNRTVQRAVNMTLPKRKRKKIEGVINAVRA